MLTKNHFNHKKKSFFISQNGIKLQSNQKLCFNTIFYITLNGFALEADDKSCTIFAYLYYNLMCDFFQLLIETKERKKMCALKVDFNCTGSSHWLHKNKKFFLS